MELKQLQRLLTQEESPTLEFKERWYAVDSPHQQTREAQKEEFIKDILALANGSVSTAGETAYLIIGPDDKERDADGQRILHHVAEPLPSIQMLLRWINNACDPALEQVILELVTLNGQDLFVFTIPFSPHVHETTKKLAGYTEHSVFLRVRDEIHIANARERKALSTIKQQHLEESEHVPPRFFGSVVGALVGGALVYAVAQSNPVLGSPVVYGLAAALVGGLLGWVQGDTVRTVRQWHRKIRSKSIVEQCVFWLICALATAALTVAMTYLMNGLHS